MNSRESIYSALLNLVSGSSPFATVSRRVVMWDQMNESDKPALFLSERVEEQLNTNGQAGIPATWRLQVDLIIYVSTNPDSAVAPASLINPLIDAVVNALAPTGADLIQNRQTLGGLVYYCRVEGKILKDEGVLGNQGVAIIPVVIIAV